MPDISMCGSATCPLAKTCYRNELSGTKPNEFRQSYFYALKEEGEDCRYYWKTKASVVKSFEDAFDKGEYK
tara:strand:- start:76 stop:288 length:213 start_codon:yes stop_codon:yes gene_type:complete